MSERREDPDKVKTVKKAVHGNPLKPQQVTGYVKVAVDDGQEMPSTVVENGVEVPLSEYRPLHKPKDIGYQHWQDEDG